jgi:ABC-type lipoprotein release transport system permease subunit
VARFNGHLLVTKYGLDFTEYEALGAEISSDPRVSAASPFAYSMVVVVRDDATASTQAAAIPPTAPAGDPDAAWDVVMDADARLPAAVAGPALLGARAGVRSR